MRMQKERVVTLWEVDSATTSITTNLHYWFDNDGSSLISDASNIPAGAWFTLDTSGADYMAVQFTCTSANVVGSPAGSTTAAVFPHAQGSIIPMATGGPAGFPTAIPGTGVTASIDSSLRRGTNLNIYHNDWASAAVEHVPSNKRFDGNTWWPQGVTPADGVESAWWFWVGNRQIVLLDPGTSSAISYEHPNVKGLSEVAIAIKQVTTATMPTSTDFTAKLQAVLYKDVATLDPKQFYTSGYKQHVEET